MSEGERLRAGQMVRIGEDGKVYPWHPPAVADGTIEDLVDRMMLETRRPHPLATRLLDAAPAPPRTPNATENGR